MGLLQPSTLMLSKLTDCRMVLLKSELHEYLMWTSRMQAVRANSLLLLPQHLDNLWKSPRHKHQLENKSHSHLTKKAQYKSKFHMMVHQFLVAHSHWNV